MTPGIRTTGMVLVVDVCAAAAAAATTAAAAAAVAVMAGAEGVGPHDADFFLLLLLANPERSMLLQIVMVLKRIR